MHPRHMNSFRIFYDIHSLNYTYGMFSKYMLNKTRTNFIFSSSLHAEGLLKGSGNPISNEPSITSKWKRKPENTSTELQLNFIIDVILPWC